MHLFLCFTWHTGGLRNYACQVGVVHYVQLPEALAENVLKKTCSFIRKWWSVKTKSVHEKKGNSEKSFWKKQNACKTKTSNCQNTRFKHLFNKEIKLILNAFTFSSAYFLSTLKKVQIKIQCFQMLEIQYFHWGVLMPFSPLPNYALIIFETITFQSGWENFPLFSPQNYFGMIKKASGFSSQIGNLYCHSDAHSHTLLSSFRIRILWNKPSIMNAKDEK